MNDNLHDVLTCDKCKTELQPAALLFGTTPGWTCKCGWGSMTKREFRETFGHSFKRIRNQNILSGGAYSGNSHQRRKQRRAMLRLLESARRINSYVLDGQS